jgi:hypothetical protein
VRERGEGLLDLLVIVELAHRFGRARVCRGALLLCGFNAPLHLAACGIAPCPLLTRQVALGECPLHLGTLLALPTTHPRAAPIASATPPKSSTVIVMDK